MEELSGFKENLMKKINDPNRNKAPEKLRKEQDEQLNKFEKEEAVLQEALVRIKALK